MTSQIFDLGKVAWWRWCFLAVFFVSLCVLGIIFLYPFLAERHYRDGFNFDAAQRYRYAIEEFDKAVYYAPWESHYWMALGRSYEAAAEKESVTSEKIRLYRNAITAYDETVRLDEKNPWHYSRLGSVYLQLAGLVPTEAEKYLQKAEHYTRFAARTDNQNPLFQINLAYFLHRLGNFEEAKKYYEKTLSYDDRFAEAYYNLADIYRRQNATQNVLAMYLNIVEKNPDFPGIYVALSNMYLAEKDYAKAAFFLEKEVAKHPDYTEGMTNLAALYYQLQAWGPAANLYSKLINMHPDNAQLVLVYAQSLLSDGRPDEALGALARFLAISPNPEIQKKYEQLKRAYR